MKNITFFISILLIAAYGCNPFKQANKIANSGKQKTVYPQSSFDTVNAKRALEYGATDIEGIAFTRGSKVLGPPSIFAKKIYAKNCKVLLLPVNQYFYAWKKLRNHRENKRTFVGYDNKAFSYRIETFTDEYGRFKFDRMKPGKYFLQVIIPWSESRTAKRLTGSSYANTNYGTIRVDSYANYNYYVNFADRAEKIITISPGQKTLQVVLR
jgi:hypothetical protein